MKCCVLSSAILFSLIFGQVSAILQQAQKNTAKYHSIIDNMKQFSKLYKLPTDLATRTIDFFMSTWAMNKGIDTDEVCRHLIFVERIDPQEIKLFHDFTLCVKLSKLSGAPNNCQKEQILLRNFYSKRKAKNSQITVLPSIKIFGVFLLTLL